MKVKTKRGNQRHFTQRNVVIIKNKKAQMPLPEEELLDDLIKCRRTALKSYSRSLVECPYIPLTKNQKVNMIEDMNESSTTRFKKYSNIFEQIKNQINDINNSLLNNSNINDYSGNKKNIIINCTPEDYIEEKEEENLLSPKLSKEGKKHLDFNLCLHELNNSSSNSWSDEKPDQNGDDYVNPDTLRENIHISQIHLSPQLKSMYKTKIANGDINNDIYKTTACSTTGNNSMILPSKNEIKVKGKYHEFNKQEFYCEPKLGNTDHDNIEDNKSVNIKYCNCSIF